MSETETLKQELPQDEVKEKASDIAIDETREELAKMYLLFLDQQKWGILSTWAGVWMNLNPIQKDTIKYLTSESEEKKDIFKTFFNNAKKKLVEKFTGGTFVEYDKKSLNYMKEIMWNNKKLNTLMAEIKENQDDKKKIQELMSQIATGMYLTTVSSSPITTSESVDPSADTSLPANQPEVSSESMERIPGEYVYPVSGVKINSPFWPRVLNGKPEDHKGIDIADSTTQHDILSVGNGVVEYVATKEDNEFSWYGNCIVVKLENGYRVLYGHLESYTVKVWDKVESSQVIWVMGNSGCEWTGKHLHLEVREWSADNSLHSDDRAIYFNSKAIDPLRMLPVSKDMVQPNLIADNKIKSQLFIPETMA